MRTFRLMFGDSHPTAPLKPLTGLNFALCIFASTSTTVNQFDTFSTADLFELSLGVDVHIADFTVESFVLQSSRQLRRRGQLGLDPRSREGFDGSVTAACLQHCLVLSAWADTRKVTSAECQTQYEQAKLDGRRSLTAVVGLQLGGRVDGHFAEGAVEKSYRFLFLCFPLWSHLRLSSSLCLFLRRPWAGWRGRIRGCFHCFRGAAWWGRVSGWGF